MGYINAIIQGIIQGLTEFLPVSSSGHLSVFQYLTGQSSSASAGFSVLLHFGTLIAVIIAFRRRIMSLITEFFRMLFDFFRYGKPQRLARKRYESRRMIIMLIIALIPLVLVYFIKDSIEALASNQSIVEEGIFFLITSFLLFLACRKGTGKKKASQMRVSDAVAVGIAQAVAPLPGISRSGSTICVALIRGMEKEYAVEFSFILGIPAVLAANVLEFLDIIKQGMQFETGPVIAGVAAAVVFGLLAIKLVKWMAANNRFMIFAIYTLIIGVATLTAGIVDMITMGAVREAVMNLLI